MKRITAVLIGAGDRGNAYARYALSHPHEMGFVAVAEPDAAKRERFRIAHNIPDDMCFADGCELLEKPKLADAALVCTMDRQHFEPAMAALRKGYHVLLEKPMSPEPAECIEMAECAEKHGRVLSICHVARYAPFFFTIKRLLDEGRIGKLMSVQHNENVAYWHYAHSFVRGNWRNSKESSPMILQKSCHDMDMLHWLVGAECTKLSSFGSLLQFRKENAPEGAPDRCLDGCPAEKQCPYNAFRQYLSKDAYWIKDMISFDHDFDSRLKALKEGPYGRCVYKCDNDVVDHQVVSMEFANGVTAVFTMHAFAVNYGRSIRLVGTKGEIRGLSEKHEIEVSDFLTETKDVISLKESLFAHGGGDNGVVEDFVQLVQKDGKVQGLTSARASVHSHIMAFAAEESRLGGGVIDLKEYADSVKRGRIK